MRDKLRVGVLGATGIVGQKLVELLSNHPWFKVEFLAASPESVGRRYGEVVEWMVSASCPGEVRDLPLGRPDPENVPKSIDMVFSALPSDVAMEVEPGLARRGFVVISNASPMRLDADVPLLNPEVNYDHIKVVRLQKEARGWQGALLKNPNCTAAILTLSLAPLADFGLEEVVVTTMQSISGAGLRGVPGYAIVDNIIPFIAGEEEKIVSETRKIFGSVSEEGIRPAGMQVVATATRVPVLEGHLASVYVRLSAGVSAEEVVRAMEGFRSIPQEVGLPTAPRNPVVVRRQDDRPQPRLDRMEGGGMSVVVGRVAALKSRDGAWVRYLVLGHNLLRGAAGVALMVAELYAKEEGMV